MENMLNEGRGIERWINNGSSALPKFLQEGAVKSSHFPSDVNELRNDSTY